MKYSLVKDTGNYTYYNIGLEKYLMESCNEDEIILYLWINDPSVIAGCNQNVLKEWNDDYLRENKIYPVRRFTGGGCVYHDLGNLNYSFISHSKHKDIKKWLSIILDSVRAFAIEAKFTGRNDLTSANRKFGGTAWLEENDRVLFHGTLLIDIDIEKMLKCLTPSILKFEGKAIDSVKSRVVNLKSLNPSITTSNLIRTIEEKFKQGYCKLGSDCNLERKHILVSERLNEIVNKLTCDKWIYARNANCNIAKEYRIKNQIISLNFKIREAVIEDVTAFTDSMDIGLAKKIESSLRGQVYLGKNVENILNDLF